MTAGWDGGSEGHGRRKGGREGAVRAAERCGAGPPAYLAAFDVVVQVVSELAQGGDGGFGLDVPVALEKRE
jgi:hypothetical protein